MKIILSNIAAVLIPKKNNLCLKFREKKNNLKLINHIYLTIQ